MALDVRLAPRYVVLSIGRGRRCLRLHSTLLRASVIVTRPFQVRHAKPFIARRIWKVFNARAWEACC